MPKIVISYRRQDSEAITGRIRDRLASQYGDASIFMDIDSIPFGVDFRDHIGEALRETDMLIAVIGPKWTGAHKGGRSSRISEETDPVRIEVENALERGIPVIPILVNNATMPKTTELPDRLKELSFRNAATVDSGRDFHQHMDRLTRSLDQILAGRAKAADAAEAAVVDPGADVAAAAEPAPVEPQPEAPVPAAAPAAKRKPAKKPSEVAPSAAPMAAFTAPSPADVPASDPQPAVVMRTATSPATVSSAPAEAAAGPVIDPVPSPSPKRWLAVAASLMVCVAAAGGAYVYWKSPPSPPRPPAIAEVDKIPAEETHEEHPVTPIVPIVAPFDTRCKREDGPAFYDDFKSPDRGWGQTGPTYYFNDNQMVLKSKENAAEQRIYLPLLFKHATICSEFTSPAELKKVDGTASAGIAFWASDYQNYYIAVVYTDGTYASYRKIAGSWSTVVPRAKAASIRSGTNVVNQMKIATGENVASMFVNGVKVVDIWGQPLARGGSAGLYGQSEADAQNEWKFSSIAVARLDDAAAPSAKALVPAANAALLDACKPNASVAFFDNFNPHNAGWYAPADTHSFNDGEIIIKPKAKSNAQMFFPSLIFKAATVCGDIKSPSQAKPSGSSNGSLVFWAVDYQNYYTASVYQDGTYDVYRRIDGRWEQVRPRSPAPSIVQGNSAVNRMKIAFDGDVATLILNDASVIQFTGQPPAAGSFVGIAADSDPDAETEWTFLNTVVMVDDKPAAAKPPSVNPDATAAASACKSSSNPVGFFDNFKSPDLGWGKTGDDRSFQNGQMVLRSKNAVPQSWIYTPLVFRNATICSDFVAPSTLEKADGLAAGGIIFWASDYQNYYMVEIFTDGTYAVFRRLANKWIEVSARRKADGIRQGPGAVNRVKVTIAGDIVTLFANDKKIADLWGQSPSRGGAVGLYGQAETDKEQEWHFSNIVVLEDKQAAPSLPTGAAAVAAKCKDNGSLAFFDDFKALDPGWGSLAAIYSLKDGALDVKPVQNRTSALIYFPLVFTGATACVEIKSPSPIEKPSDSGSAGIIFWAVDYKDYYVASLLPDGTYSVSRRLDGEWVTVVPAAKASMINQGPDAINRMKITTEQSSATIYINDTLVIGFRGQPATGGTAFGLYVESGTTQEYQWRFSNMAVLK